MQFTRSITKIAQTTIFNIPSTRSKPEKELAQLKHVVEAVLQKGTDSKLWKALVDQEKKDVPDLKMMDTDLIDALSLIDGAGNATKVPLVDAIAIAQFFKFVDHQREKNVALTVLPLETGRPSLAWTAHPSTTTCHLLEIKTKQSNTGSSSCSTVCDFKRGIKRDQDKFPILKRNQDWDKVQQDTIIQAKAQDVEDVLDPACMPNGPTQVELFQEKIMMGLFTATLHTSKGKLLVLPHTKTDDAQKLWGELVDCASNSEFTEKEAEDLLEYLITPKINDGKRKGPAHGYDLHWQKEVSLQKRMANNLMAPNFCNVSSMLSQTSLILLLSKTLPTC